MEEELAAWIEALRAQNARVTRSSVQREVLTTMVPFSIWSLLLMGNMDFRASDGWQQNFLQRQQFFLRRRTTVSQRLPRDLVPKVTWIHHGDKEAPLPEEVSALSHIGNMDETLLRCDIPGDLVRLQSLTLARGLFQPHYRP